MSDTPKADDIYEDIVEGILGGGHNSGVEVMYEDMCEFETVLRRLVAFVEVMPDDWMAWCEATSDYRGSLKVAKEFLDSRVEE